MNKIILGLLLNLLIYGSVSAQIYMYGTTLEGGTNNLGTIYRVDQNGQNYEKVFDFSTTTGGRPTAGLTLANNGKLYGLTNIEGQIANAGATVKLGSFFEFDPLTNNFQVIQYFDELSLTGYSHNDSPVLSASGLLYAASPISGPTLSDDGKIWSYDVNTNTIQVLATITSSAYGFCDSKLMEATDGNLYFTTAQGVNFGAVVRFNTQSNLLENIFTSTGGGTPTQDQFESAINNPLFEASDGFLYGASRAGGNNGKGNVFKIDKNGNNYQTLFSFTFGLNTEGFDPQGGFVEKNGFLYSATKQLQALDQYSGTFYKIEIATGNLTFTNLLDLEGVSPLGTFVESPNGRLYITCSGGNENSGSIVELRLSNGVITQRYAFNNNDSSTPLRNSLEIVDFSALSIDESSLLDNIVKTYPNPFQDIVNIKVEGSHLIETIKILDMKGSELYIDNSISNESNLNTSFLSSGVYLLYIQTDLGSTTRKIIKE